MARRRNIVVRLALLTAVILLGGSSAPLDATPDLELVRGRVQGGGADHLGAGTLSLDGTIGQPEAGASPRTSRWLLVPGFQATEADPQLLFSDGFESGGTGAWTGGSP